MRKHLMLIAVVGAAILNPYAASAAEGDTSAPTPTTKATKAEKKAAAEARKKAGAEAAKTEKVGEGATGAMAAGPKATKEEKKAAAAKRKAEMAEAAKKGELKPVGEK